MAYNSEQYTLSTDMTGLTPDRVACVAGRIVMPVVLFSPLEPACKASDQAMVGFLACQSHLTCS